MRAIHFSTDRFAERERYEAWRNRGWPSLAPVMDTDEPDGPFHAHCSTYALGAVTVTYTRISGQFYRRTRQAIRADQIDQIGVLVMLAGDYTGTTDSGSFEGASGSVLVGDLGRPHAQVSSDAETVQLSIPRQFARAQLPVLEGIHGRVIGPDHAAILLAHLRMLRPHLDDAAASAGARLGLGLLQSLGIALEGSGHLQADHVARPERSLMRARWLIDHHLADPALDVDRLVALSGIPRSTLYRLFEPHGGIAAFVRRQRLDTARRMLEDPREARQIAEIAHAVGFMDPAQLSRAFRQEFGLTPSEARWRRPGGR